MIAVEQYCRVEPSKVNPDQWYLQVNVGGIWEDIAIGSIFECGIHMGAIQIAMLDFYIAQSKVSAAGNGE